MFLLSFGDLIISIIALEFGSSYLIFLNPQFFQESIVDENGKYTKSAGEKLAGLFVLSNECVNKVLSLINKDCLLNVERFEHSYPYDWRTKQPVILRASQQWFIDTDQIKQKTVVSFCNFTLF